MFVFLNRNTGYEAADSVTYLVTELTRGNDVEKQRISSAKKVHFFLLPTTKSRMTQYKDKRRIHKTLISPVLSFGWEARTVTQSLEEKLAIFGRKIRKRIFGPVYESDLGWRLCIMKSSTNC
jgi:hypothetical protein